MDMNNNLDTRFQENQKVDQVADTAADTGASSFNVTEMKRAGGKLKQEVAAQVVAQGKGTSGVDTLASPEAYGKMAGSYTGDGKAVLGNFANTPVLNKDHQGDSREGKKLSDPNKDINLMASEQYATYFEQPKALAQDRDSTVGYNGNPANISARSQKNSGFTPAELTYDRSVDEIRKDAAIFVVGQTVNAEPGFYPTKTGMKTVDGSLKFYPQGENFSENKGPKRGNYMPHSIKATFRSDDSGTYLRSFSIEETDLSITGAPHSVVNDSSASAVIAANRAELTRQAIDNDHGSPTSPKYNPLGRSVQQPTATMAYLMDMESVSGAIMTAATRFALKSRAYYLSRVGKDGISQLEPVIDALYGNILNANDAASTIENFKSKKGIDAACPYFSSEWNKLGSAAVLLKVFDSIGKYKTKADVVNQPRGLKLPLQTGLNNHTPFHVSEEFMKALNAIDVFSTIDREYDPGAPTMVLDNLAYVLPYSWKNALSFTRDNAYSGRKYSSELFVYSYQAGQGNQRYYIKVGEPILNGVAWFLEQYASSFYSALGDDKEGDDDEGDRTIVIPVVSSTTHFSLFDYIICASSAYILYERTNSMKDILDEEQHTGYPFAHLKGITKDDICKPTNYGALSMFDRINVKQMTPASAMKWIMPEVFTPIGDDTMLPWYYAQSDFRKVSDNKFSQVDEPSHFPAPVIRSGVALSYLDDFYGMTLKDQLLAIDKMSCVPGSTMRGVHEGYFYKYGVDSEGLVILKGYNILFEGYASTPRQIGWTFDLPLGVCQVVDSYHSNNNDVKDRLYFLSDVIKGVNAKNSSFRARAYSGFYSDPASDILSSEVVNIGRGQAFAQKWADKFASTVQESSPFFNVSLSMTDGLARNNGNDADDILVVADNTAFKPFVNIDDEHLTNKKSIFAMMKTMWARIQKLPFIINPFDAGSSASNKGVIDPFDFAYLFGLAGFMSVTYFEEMSNRMSDKYAKMFNFTEDPYFNDSPLYK